MGLEVVACCCGTWLRFMISLVGLSLFLLVAVVVSLVVFGARALPCPVDTQSRTSPLLAKASTWFSPSAPGTVFELESCLVWLSTALSRTCRRTRPRGNLFGISLSSISTSLVCRSTKTIRLRKLTARTLVLFDGNILTWWRQTPPTARKCCSSQGSLVKKMRVVRSSATSQAHDEGFYNVGSIHDGDQANAPIRYGLDEPTIRSVMCHARTGGQASPVSSATPGGENRQCRNSTKCVGLFLPPPHHDIQIWPKSIRAGPGTRRERESTKQENRKTGETAHKKAETDLH